MGMRVHQFIREDSGCCTYVLNAEPSKEYLIVDPLMDAERFLEPVYSVKGDVVGVIDTHIHADHLSGAREIQRLTGCDVIMHESSPLNFPYKPMSEGNFRLGGLDIRVMHTPGHAPEHICLLIDGRVLLAGDCLLVRDVGRTDLGRGDPNQLYTSLFMKVMSLEDNVEVLPGHVGKKHFVSGDISSTIGIERRSNPALQMGSREEFIKYMTEDWPPKPGHYQIYIKVNSGQQDLADAQEIVKTSEGELYTR